MRILYIIGFIFLVYLLLAYNGRPSKTRETCLNRYNDFKYTYPDSNEKQILYLMVQERFPNKQVDEINDFIERRDYDIELIIEGIIHSEATGRFY